MVLQNQTLFSDVRRREIMGLGEGRKVISMGYVVEPGFIVLWSNGMVLNIINIIYLVKFDLNSYRAWKRHSIELSL